MRSGLIVTTLVDTLCAELFTCVFLKQRIAWRDLIDQRRRVANVRYCLKAWICPGALATPSLGVNLPRLRLPSRAYLVAVKRSAFQWFYCRDGPDPVSEAEWN